MRRRAALLAILMCIVIVGCTCKSDGSMVEEIEHTAEDAGTDFNSTESSSTSSPDPSDNDSEDDPHSLILEGLVINKKYFHMGYDNVLKLHPQSQYDYRFNIIDDIIRIDWIAARGGYAFDGPHEEWRYTLNVDDSELPIIQRSNSIIADCGFDAPGGLADDTWMDDPMSVEDIWIRLIFKPFYPLPGTPYAPHKDWIIYIDPDNPDNAVLAQQCPDNLNQWSLCLLPGYGAWLNIETDMFIRF